MLCAQNILSQGELAEIELGLQQISEEIAQNSFAWRVDREDVHMNIEARLTEIIGDTGKKLHTGRSRNDHVATDIRLWLREAIDAVTEQLTRLQQGIVELAATCHLPIIPVV